MAFDNAISVVELDVRSATFQDTVAALDREFGFMQSSATGDITKLEDFARLRALTNPFYRTYFPYLGHDYVPLYHSLWKLRLQDVVEIENTHQDGGVHYFARNGYASRMVTIWTNLYKEPVPGLLPSDMGLFVVDNAQPANRGLYEKLAKADTHFFQKRPGQLQDGMYVGGGVVRFEPGQLEKTYFDYAPGTSISFNSHLLHGSKRLSRDRGSFSAAELGRFRVSLTSVWLHTDDVDWSVVSLPEEDHERLYLSRLDPSEREVMKNLFADACRAESQRLTYIKRLIHAARNDVDQGRPRAGDEV